MRQKLDVSYARLHMKAFSTATEWEAKAGAEKQKTDLMQVFDLNRNTVRANPTKAAELAEATRNLISKAPGFDETLKQKWMQQETQALFDTAMEAEVTRLETDKGVTSGKVKNYLAGFASEESPWMTNASAEAFARNHTRLQRLNETLATKEQHYVDQNFKEEIDQIAATGHDKGAYTESWIRANIADPLKAESMVKQQAIARNAGRGMAFVKDAPLPAVKAKLKELEAQRINTNDFHLVEAEYTAIKQSMERRNQEFANDQVGYVKKVSDVVKSNYSMMNEVLADKNLDMGTKQEAVSRYYETLKTEQQKLYPGITPTLLDKEQVGQIKMQLERVSKDEKGAVEALEVLQTQMQLAGNNWPIVARDLRAGKALTDSQYIAATMAYKPEYRYVAEDLMRASTIKIQDKDLPKGAAKQIQTAVDQALAPLKPTLDSLADGPEILMAYKNGITEAVKFKAATGANVDISALATDYANKTVLESYHFEKTYRIPKNQNIQAIKSNANSILKSLDTLPIKVPEFMPGADGWSPRPEDSEKLYRDSLRRHGRLVNRGDDRGLRLIDEHGRQVLDVRGEPLSWDWSELQNVAITEAERAERIKREALANNQRFIQAVIP